MTRCPCVPHTLDTMGHYVPIVGHAANAFTTTCSARARAKLEIGQVDIDGSRQQIKGGIGQIEIAIKNARNGALRPNLRQRCQDKGNMGSRVTADKAERTRPLCLALEDARRQLHRGYRYAIGGVEGKTGSGAEMAGGGTAAKEDGMGWAQRLFLAHVQHFAGDIAGWSDMTTPFGRGTRIATTMGAEGAIGQLCLGRDGRLLNLLKVKGVWDARHSLAQSSPKRSRRRSSAPSRRAVTMRPPPGPRATTITAREKKLLSPTKI